MCQNVEMSSSSCHFGISFCWQSKKIHSFMSFNALKFAFPFFLSIFAPWIMINSENCIRWNEQLYCLGWFQHSVFGPRVRPSLRTELTMKTSCGLHRRHRLQIRQRKVRSRNFGRRQQRHHHRLWCRRRPLHCLWSHRRLLHHLRCHRRQLHQVNSPVWQLQLLL